MPFNRSWITVELLSAKNIVSATGWSIKLHTIAIFIKLAALKILLFVTLSLGGKAWEVCKDQRKPNPSLKCHDFWIPYFRHIHFQFFCIFNASLYVISMLVPKFVVALLPYLLFWIFLVFPFHLIVSDCINIINLINQRVDNDFIITFFNENVSSLITVLSPSSLTTVASSILPTLVYTSFQSPEHPEHFYFHPTMINFLRMCRSSNYWIWYFFLMIL